MSRLLRTDLPDDDWQALNDLAERDGVKIGVYVKRLLIDHARTTSLVPKIEKGDRSIPPVSGNKMSPAEWNSLREWLAAQGVDPVSQGLTTRQAALAWARDNGYTS